MPDESNRSDSSPQSSSSSQDRSAVDNIRDLTAASKQLVEAGKQITENLTQLSQRAEHASDIGSQVLKSPWLLVAGALTAGTFLILLSRKR